MFVPSKLIDKDQLSALLQSYSDYRGSELW